MGDSNIWDLTLDDGNKGGAVVMVGPREAIAKAPDSHSGAYPGHVLAGRSLLDRK